MSSTQPGGAQRRSGRDALAVTITCAEGRGRRLRVRWYGAAFALALALTACEPSVPESPAGPAVHFDTIPVRIATATDTFDITAELAATAEQRAHGLMERTGLPDDHGMLFVYDAVQPANAGFWMFRTRIPLDIAFIRDDGTIGSIVMMEPCVVPNAMLCRTYPAGVPFVMALEVPRGFFAERGIATGDRVVRMDR